MLETKRGPEIRSCEQCIHTTAHTPETHATHPERRPHVSRAYSVLTCVTRYWTHALECSHILQTVTRVAPGGG